MAADRQLAGSTSALFDAVCVITGGDGAEELATSPAGLAFLAEAFRQDKFIGYTPPAAPLFAAAGLPLEPDAGVLGIDDRAGVDSYLARCAALRCRQRSPLPS